MKYTDFIGLQDYFHPVFNLQNEANADYWKQFIPTTQFYNLLGKTIDAVSSSIPANRKSICIENIFRVFSGKNSQKNCIFAEIFI
jgi:hypothetical protein